MRKYAYVYDRFLGESKIIYQNDGERGWRVFDIFENPSNAERVVEALNKNAFFEKED